MTTSQRLSLHFVKVSEVDPSQCRARVRLEELGMQSYWLPVLQYRAGNDTAYWMPSIGESVAVLLDEQGESGVVLGGVYSAANSPLASELGVFAIASRRLTIDADVEITGTVTIQGAGNAINGNEICVIGGTDSAGHTNQVSGQ
ncbi:MAG: phage baseplate assembly protein V [Cyanobacteria bacterium P01_H01_bin.26]